MVLFGILSFSWFFVTALSYPVQRTRTNDTALRIPNITMDGRNNDCGIEQYLLDNNVPGNCDILLPIDEKWYTMMLPTLCFGIYDTLYQLCQYENVTSLKIPKYHTVDFCGKAIKALDNYNFPHRKPVFLEWSPHLREGLGNQVNCTEICSHGEDVNPQCAVIVAALERLPVAMATFSQSKSSNVTQSLNVKSSTPSGFQRQPSLSTKGSEPVPVGKKAPEPAEPVEPVEPIAKTEEVQKPPPVDKTAPQSEAMKPEQVAKPDSTSSKQPVEPKLENPEFDPGMMDPGAMEDDDGPGLEAQQPDTPAEQPPDLAPPKDAPSETNKFSDDEAGVKQDNPMSFPGEPPYLSISKDDNEETNMVTYFVLMTGGALLFYIAFHNKNKLLALALEGRRTGRRGGRHSSASYSKLHSNLEETIASGPTSPSATHVLY